MYYCNLYITLVAFKTCAKELESGSVGSDEFTFPGYCLDIGMNALHTPRPSDDLTPYQHFQISL